MSDTFNHQRVALNYYWRTLVPPPPSNIYVKMCCVVFCIIIAWQILTHVDRWSRKWAACKLDSSAHRPKLGEARPRERCCWKKIIFLRLTINIDSKCIHRLRNSLFTPCSDFIGMHRPFLYLIRVHLTIALVFWSHELYTSFAPAYYIYVLRKYADSTRNYRMKTFIWGKRRSNINFRSDRQRMFVKTCFAL